MRNKCIKENLIKNFGNTLIREHSDPWNRMNKFENWIFPEEFCLIEEDSPPGPPTAVIYRRAGNMMILSNILPYICIYRYARSQYVNLLQFFCTTWMQWSALDLANAFKQCCWVWNLNKYSWNDLTYLLQHPLITIVWPERVWGRRVWSLWWMPSTWTPRQQVCQPCHWGKLVKKIAGGSSKNRIIFLLDQNGRIQNILDFSLKSFVHYLPLWQWAVSSSALQHYRCGGERSANMSLCVTVCHSV